MKVTHISSYDHGGAARSALRLHQALCGLGTESRVVVLEKSSDDHAIRSVRHEFEEAGTRETVLFREFESWYIKHNRTGLSNTFFSLNEPGLVLAALKEIREADVLHLHWVSGLVSPGSIAELQKLGKPLFWTLHDQRPFTGGCHFSAGCMKFQVDCHGCPQLGYDPFLLTRAQLRDAAQIADYRKIHFCSPSRWLARYAESSALLANRNVAVIPYGIDTEFYKPGDPSAARTALGLPHQATLLLFSADNANEKRKGFSLLVSALKECAQHPGVQQLIREQKLGLVCLGHPSAQLQEVGIPVHSLGYINSDEKVAQAYQASDLFVLPSLEDNLPNTVMEAMSCGVPVAALEAGGIPEMIVSGHNGLLANLGSVSGLAANLQALILNGEERKRFGKAAREDVLSKFPLPKQGEAYLELYHRALAGNTVQSPAEHITTVAMAPSGPEIARIVAESAPLPLQAHLHSRALALANLQKERDGHVATLHQQLDYIGKLRQENEEVRQQLEAKRVEVNRQQKILKKLPVKILRALKLV